jgi:hypothetical protein
MRCPDEDVGSYTFLGTQLLPFTLYTMGTPSVQTMAGFNLQMLKPTGS